MLVREELIERIKDYFELNIYETKVWLALLSKGVASAGEVATLSRVPRSRTYDVLESLEKKGFAIAKIGKPVKYIGVKPKSILEKIKNNVKKDAEERIQKLSNIRETDEFAKLEELYKGEKDPVKKDNMSLELKGKSNISGHLKEILPKAKKEVIVCTDAEDIKFKIRTFKQTFDILKESNISIKIALSGDEKTINQIEKWLGLKVNKIDINTKFFIVDKREILFYLSKGDNRPETEDIAIWLNSEFFTQAFANLLDLSLKNKTSNKNKTIKKTTKKTKK